MKWKDIYAQKTEYIRQGSGQIVMAIALGMAIWNLPVTGWGWTVFWGAVFLLFLVHNLAWSITGDLRMLMHYIDLHQKYMVKPMLDREDEA